jgi:hypothetical protein
MSSLLVVLQYVGWYNSLVNHALWDTWCHNWLLLLQELRWDLLRYLGYKRLSIRLLVWKRPWLTSHLLLLWRWHLSWLGPLLHSTRLLLSLATELSRRSCSWLAPILSSHLVVSWLEVSLQLLDEHLDQVHHVWSVEEVQIKIARLLLGVILPVNSVSHLLLLKLSLLLHFVEVDVELLPVEDEVVQLVLGKSG